MYVDFRKEKDCRVLYKPWNTLSLEKAKPARYPLWMIVDNSKAFVWGASYPPDYSCSLEEYTHPLTHNPLQFTRFWFFLIPFHI